jgi:hypothetical protein
LAETVVIAHRFRGPPDSGNGGYTCGVVAAHMDAPAEVTLRRPPPLGVPLQVEPTVEGGVQLLDGDVLVAEGAPRHDELDVSVPAPVTVEEAEAASATSPFWSRPDEHPFPGCFVCGPHRGEGDGLRIIVAPVFSREVAAAPWTPTADLAAQDGTVLAEFVWAALDCPSGLGAFGDDLDEPGPFVLGRLAAESHRAVRAGEKHVALGWRIHAQGRKITSGSAIFTATGELCGVARATWVALR